MNKTKLKFLLCLFLLQLLLLWMFPHHIMGHLDHVGLSPRDGQARQQWCPPQSLATSGASCSVGLRRQCLSGREPERKDYLKNLSLLLLPKEVHCTLKHDISHKINSFEYSLYREEWIHLNSSPLRGSSRLTCSPVPFPPHSTCTGWANPVLQDVLLN